MSEYEKEIEELLEKLLKKLVESLKQERVSEVEHKVVLVKEVKEIIGKESFEEFINKNSFAVICYYSPRCPACRRYLPVFNNVAKKLTPQKIAFAVLNIKEPRNRDIVLEKEVFVIPTTAIYAKGKEISRKVGYMNEEELMLYIELNRSSNK